MNAIGVTVEEATSELIQMLQSLKTKECPQVLASHISAAQQYLYRITNLSKVVATLPKVKPGEEFSPEVQQKIYPLIYQIMRDDVNLPLERGTPGLRSALDHAILSANAAAKNPAGLANFSTAVNIFNEKCAESIAANIGDIYKFLYKQYKAKQIPKEEFKKLRKALSSSLSASKKLGMRWGKPGKKLYLEAIIGTVLTMKVMLVISILWAGLNTLLWGGVITLTMGAAFGAMAVPLYFLGSVVYQFGRLAVVVRGSMEVLGRYMAH